jgi:hypothetical protein
MLFLSTKAHAANVARARAATSYQHIGLALMSVDAVELV